LSKFFIVPKEGFLNFVRETSEAIDLHDMDLAVVRKFVREDKELGTYLVLEDTGAISVFEEVITRNGEEVSRERKSTLEVTRRRPPKDAESEQESPSPTPTPRRRHAQTEEA
jgi:hypothetical protein